MGAEVYGYSAKLYGIGRRGRVKGEALGRARRLMGLLRDAGFSCGEVSLLSGGKWKTDDVRQYGAWSGVPDSSRRDAALGVFAEFVSKGYRFEDVEGYVEARKLLDPFHITVPDTVTIGRALIQSRVDVDGLAEFSDELLKAGKTVEELRARMDLDAKLDGFGLTRDVQESILKLSKHYESLEDLLDALSARYSLQLALEDERIAKKRIVSLEEEIEELEDSKRGLEEEKSSLVETLKPYRGDLAEINLLYSAGWNLGSLTIAGEFTKKWGGAKDVLEGMRLYGSLKELKAECEAKGVHVEGESKMAPEKTKPKVKTMEELLGDKDFDVSSGKPKD